MCDIYKNGDKGVEEKTLLEVIATSMEDVVQANRGGADRIELCSNLNEGGLTPSDNFIKSAIEISDIPIQVMIRPHNRTFVFSESDLQEMLRSILWAKKCGAAGVVVGALTHESRIDKQALCTMMEAASRLNITFHRAFDYTRNLEEALDDLLDFPQINRLLTSGGASNAFEANDVIARMQMRIQNTPIKLIAAAGLTADNIADFVERTKVTEVHMGRGVRIGMSIAHSIDADLVRLIKQLLKNL
ncbi:copper homeostasis protein CutC [Gorillibacterium massiliense]|uniref:copper homeostasis protein CutC n=1 Tax=Gorillibacterium massiliense TaxID=1280390 RepID=UPI0004B7F501|nr:copper homeostasis protein CutC [Gorillibacterium massiliense]